MFIYYYKHVFFSTPYLDNKFMAKLMSVFVQLKSVQLKSHFTDERNMRGLFNIFFTLKNELL